MKTKFITYVIDFLYDFSLMVAGILILTRVAFTLFSEEQISEFMFKAENEFWLGLAFVVVLITLWAFISMTIELLIEGVGKVLEIQKHDYLERNHLPAFRFGFEKFVFYFLHVILLPITLIEMGGKKLWKRLR